jgi:hypothetical protein
MGETLSRRIAALTVVLAISACSGPTAPRSVEAAPTAAASGTGARPESAAPTNEFVAEAFGAVAADLPHSWRPGCPVGPERLRRLRLSHWGFDDRPHTGTILVHEDVTAAVVEVFRQLYAARFPIRSLEPVDTYGGDDDRSMAADNTSGFNCRAAVAAGAPAWSAHAYGRAIDVNPVENPYLFAGRVLPRAGAAYVDRSVVRPGMAVAGGVLVNAFSSVGWRWGGTWRSSPDYQHFSADGG